MPDPVLPALLLVAGCVMLAGLWRLGVFTPRAVRAWSRIGRHHHLIDERPLDERLGDRMPSLASLVRATSVSRLLAIAHRGESPRRWLVKVAISVLVVGAALTAVDFAGGAVAGRLPVPPLVGAAIAGLFVPLSYVSLRGEARRRRDAIDRAIAQSLSEMAILTSGGAYTVPEALELVARCHRDRSLLELMTGDGWRRLAGTEETPPALGLGPDQLPGAATVYQRIGRAYGLQMLEGLATSVRGVAGQGLPPADVLTSLSEATGKKLIADLAVATEQARPRMALAIGLMVLPLLSLILYPAAVAIETAFQ
jgi:hypothetical protein